MTSKRPYCTLSIALFSIILFLNCDCPPVDKSKKSISEHISASQQIIKVIGQSSTYNTYNFKVLTVFKGNLVEGQIVKGEAADNCELIIRHGSTYILFGYMDEVFHTSGCGLSFNIDKPFPLFPPPPPPPLDSIKSTNAPSSKNKKWEVKYDHKFAKRIIRQLERYKQKSTIQFTN